MHFMPPGFGLNHAACAGGFIAPKSHVVFIEDVGESALYRGAVSQFRELVDAGDYRSILNIALRKDGVLFGSITQ
jgi:hypothetical protein